MHGLSRFLFSPFLLLLSLLLPSKEGLKDTFKKQQQNKVKLEPSKVPASEEPRSAPEVAGGTASWETHRVKGQQTGSQLHLGATRKHHH